MNHTIMAGNAATAAHSLPVSANHTTAHMAKLKPAHFSAFSNVLGSAATYQRDSSNTASNKPTPRMNIESISHSPF